jgi:hypothetical protein
VKKRELKRIKRGKMRLELFGYRVVMTDRLYALKLWNPGKQAFVTLRDLFECEDDAWLSVIEENLG